MVHVVKSKKTLANGKKVTYLYLAHNIRKNGMTVKEWMIPLGKKEIAIKNLKEIAKSQKGFFPENAEHLSSALICAYLDIFEELDLVGIINEQTTKKRSQGLTPGHYLLFCILNRLVAPKSKRQLESWFEETLLTELYPDAAENLTSQHIWNHFTYFDEENLKTIFFNLLQAVQQSYGYTTGTFLLDATNFYTYIGDHPLNTLLKRGHNKEKRNHLNQINFTLVIDQEKEFPVYYKTFPGNVPDSKHFTEILPEISEWFQKLNSPQPKPIITIVFDKGNNSPEAMEIIDQNEWKFIGSLRPSMFKDLLKEPYTEFSKIYDTKNKHAVYAFRREATVYTGERRVIIVTFDKRLHTLEYHLAKRFDELCEFSILKLNTKPQWRDPTKISKHIDTQILKQKDFKKIITVILESTIQSAINYQELRWGLDAKQFTDQVKSFGKSIIFSNKMDWSTKDIVLGYRSQFKVEQKFRDMKSTNYIKTRPIFHWRDRTIRVHIYICMLAVMGQALLKLRFKQAKLKGSFLELVADLEKIRKINLIYDKGRNKKAIIPRLTQNQKKIVSKLNLAHYFS